MALLKLKDLRAMRPDDRRAKLRELDDELMHERGVAAMGGAPASPGKMRALRKNIARILTVEREAELAEKRPAEAPVTKSEKKKSKAAKRRPEEADEAAEDSDTESLDGEDQEEKK
jgi:large subunit ribosomal protein L29